MPVGAPPYPSHAITQDFGLITMFPLVRAITPAKDAPPGSHGTIVRPDGPAQLGERRTWRRSRIPRSLPPNLRRVTWPARSRSLWPLPSLPHHPRSRTQLPPRIHPTADQGPKPETRVAAIGDSDFAANAYLGIEGNRDLFMNTVNWLSQQESLIAIRPREAADRRITLTANTSVGMFWITIVVIPAIVLGAGVFTWWRRR